MQLLKFSITLVCLSLLIFPTKSQPNDYFGYNCTDTNNFIENSTYQSNRDLLLSSLSSNTTLNNNGFTNGFYNLKVGSNTTDPVYGLFLCRGDVDTSTCQKCVNIATSIIVQSFPIETEATAWFNECFLRYSNLRFFSTVEMSPTASLHNRYNISEPEQFNVVLVATLNDIATQASNNAKRFKTKEVVNSTMFRTLYSLVQCMPDLSSSDCHTCLSNAIEYLPTCCGGKQGGIVLVRSCNIRYEIYPFYNKALTLAREPPPVPPPPKGEPLVVLPPPPKAGKGGKNTTMIIIIIVSSVTIVAALLGFWYYSSSPRKRRQLGERTSQDILLRNNRGEINCFDLATIQAATNNFSDANELGEGGFGPVYKIQKIVWS